MSDRPGLHGLRSNFGVGVFLRPGATVLVRHVRRRFSSRLAIYFAASTESSILARDTPLWLTPGMEYVARDPVQPFKRARTGAAVTAAPSPIPLPPPDFPAGPVAMLGLDAESTQFAVDNRVRVVIGELAVLGFVELALRCVFCHQACAPFHLQPGNHGAPSNGGDDAMASAASSHMLLASRYDAPPPAPRAGVEWSGAPIHHGPSEHAHVPGETVEEVLAARAWQAPLACPACRRAWGIASPTGVRALTPRDVALAVWTVARANETQANTWVRAVEQTAVAAAAAAVHPMAGLDGRRGASVPVCGDASVADAPSVWMQRASVPVGLGSPVVHVAEVAASGLALHIVLKSKIDDGSGTGQAEWSSAAAATLLDWPVGWWMQLAALLGQVGALHYTRKAGLYIAGMGRAGSGADDLTNSRDVSAALTEWVERLRAVERSARWVWAAQPVISAATARQWLPRLTTSATSALAASSVHGADDGDDLRGEGGASGSGSGGPPGTVRLTLGNTGAEIISAGRPARAYRIVATGRADDGATRRHVGAWLLKQLVDR